MTRIFELSAASVGVRRIAVTLNDEGVRAPAPRRAGRSRSWAPSTVREVLHRELYRGVIVWGRVRKRDRWGVKKYVEQPEREWLRVPAPELRIVDEGVWEAAHRQLREAKATYLAATAQRPGGRPPSSAGGSKYLLTGLAQCTCGGGMIVRSRDYGRTRRFAYACHYHHARGRSVCGNGLEAPMEAADRRVLSAIESELMRPGIVERAIREALALLYPSDLADRRDALLTRLRGVEAELVRLTDAIAAGGDLPALVQAIKEREGQRARCERDLAALDAAARAGRLDTRRTEAEIRRRLLDWQGLLARQPAEARQILQVFLVGRLTFTPIPDERRYALTGEGTFERLLLAVDNRSIAVVTPAGFVRSCRRSSRGRCWSRDPSRVGSGAPGARRSSS